VEEKRFSKKNAQQKVINLPALQYSKIVWVLKKNSQTTGYDI